MSRIQLSKTSYLSCFRGICIREFTRFVHQYPRLIASIVRPLLWFFIFTAGFKSQWMQQSEQSYQLYVISGLIAMVQLFHAMSSSLSMVYDRETGSMRLLLTSPFPRNYLLACRILSNTLVSVIQVGIFLAVVSIFGDYFSLKSALYLIPLLLLSGMMLGMFGLFLSSLIHQMENFAGVMNFVIFPIFFASTALYPLSQISEGSIAVYYIAQLNPFTYVVELIRSGLAESINIEAALWVSLSLIAFTSLAFYAYAPKRVRALS